jgi:autotransporter translocation and assembly factor TamB
VQLFGRGGVEHLEGRQGPGRAAPQAAQRRGTPPGRRQHDQRRSERELERGQPRGRPAASPGPRAASPSGDGPPITLAVDVSAPRAVFVRGRGLEAELGGDVSVRGRLTAPEITGALELRRGEITLAGKRLEFERGRLSQ